MEAPRHIAFKYLRIALYRLTGSDSENAWLIYQKMKQAQVDSLLKSNHYGQLLMTMKYGDATVIPRMVSVLQDMKRDQEPNSHHLSQVLYAMSRQGKVEAACQLIQTFKPEQLTPSHYQTLVQTLHNRKNHNAKLTEKVLNMLTKAMKKNHVVLNKPTVTQMVSQLSKDDKVDLIVDFLKAFEQVNTHSAMNNNNSNNNKNDHHYNVHIYTALISSFAKQANPTSARHVFDEMKRQGIRPNQVTYTALIEAYGKAGNFTSAIRILNRAKQTYRKLLPSMVTSLLVNAVQHGNLNIAERTVAILKREMDLNEMDLKLKSALLWVKVHKDLDRARSFFDKLYKDGHVDHIMVNHLVTGAGRLGSKSVVYDQFSLHNKLLPSEHIETEVRASHHLTEALFRCRDVPAALGVFIQMRQISIPDDITLAMVIQGLVNNNEHNLAWRLFKTLRNDGVEPNLHAYSSILKALSHNDISIIKKPQSRVDPDLILAAGIRSSAESSAAVPNTTEALNLFRNMTGFQHPNAYIYTTLISCFAKQDLNSAVKVFTHMCSSDVRPSTETYTALLQGCAMFRNSTMALSVFNHMSEASVTPNAATWRYLLKSLVRSKVDKKEIDKVGKMARKALKVSDS
ncbi:hypothetical protein K501DRAFT_284128 [Backusella circina FSU 941]|nr:hypothetical protein K501DRAFT_284128 [Backusella circina FSU 941]